jgi:hypothetical protein
MTLEHDGVAFGILYAKLTELAKRGKDRTKALAWVKAEGEEYGTFKWVCAQLGLKQDWAMLHLYKQSRHSIKDVVKKFLKEVENKKEQHAG